MVFREPRLILRSWRLTEKLLDAVLCELAVVASGQPCLIVGDLNIEPEKIPWLFKGFMVGHWFDLQSSWAAASGVAPLPSCCSSFGSCDQSRRDFVLGCPLAASALEWCEVIQDRWVLLHYDVRASFSRGRWSARACLPVRFSVLWVSSAWSIWSFSAEVSLVPAFVSAGGPVPEAGFRLGRGAAQFRHVFLGSLVLGRHRSDLGSFRSRCPSI